ncbi:uncharacterized protein LOC127130281 [Lathyrus oleraceus]|uniref:uncharacterized protein LOC127130281 n=1 Tax=Pisum sativum TaxID=3888 RepID=UPI0021D380FA|nr:uncharacterized protein LOC127130281 [Pisum sativum]
MRKSQAGGRTLASVKCFKCDESGHYANKCKNNVMRCFTCGKTGHRVVDCMSDGLICYNCGKNGHIITNCQNPEKAQSGGKVFTLFGIETTSIDYLIRGTCFINGISLIVIIDTGATYLFVSLDYAEKLGLKLSYMDGNMIVDTRLWVCVILGMNLLEFDHVIINYFAKMVSFPKFDTSDELFVSAKLVNEFVKDGAATFIYDISFYKGRD